MVNNCLYNKGYTCKLIGIRLCVNSNVVSFLLKAADVEIKHNVITTTKPKIKLPIEEIKYLYLEAGYDVLDLSIKYHVSTTTILKRLKEVGVKIKGRKLKTDKLNVNTITKLYWEDKKTTDEIAKLYNMNGMTVINYLRKNNIPRRKSKNRNEEKPYAKENN